MRYAALEGLGLLSQADLMMLARVETAQAKRDLQQLETAAKTTGGTLDKDLGQPVADVDKGMSRMSGASLALAGVLAGVVLSAVNVVSIAIQNAAKAIASFVADSVELAGKFSPAWTQSLTAVSNSWDSFRQQIGNFFVLSPSLIAANNSIAQSLQAWSNELVSSRDAMLPFILTIQAMADVVLRLAEASLMAARATAQFWALMPGGLGDVGKDTVRALDEIYVGIERVRFALAQAAAAAGQAFFSSGGANNFPVFGPDSSLAGGAGGPGGSGKGGAGAGFGPGLNTGWFGIDPVGFQTAGEAIRSSITSVSEVMAPLGTQITLMNQQLREMRENTAGSAQMFYDFVPALESSSIQMSITSAVTDQLIGAFEQLVLTGNFSARSFVKAVGLQVAGVLGKLAIEAFTRAQMEQALALASAAAGDYRGSILHSVAAASFLNTARAAGIGAAVAGAAALGAGLTDGGGSSGGGGGGRGGRRDVTPTGTTAAPAAMQQTVTIYLDGQGFIQDPTAFAQSLQDSLDRVNKRRGRG